MGWSMKVCHLGVGQGLAVYVKVKYNDVRYLALFDLGSTSNAGVYEPAMAALVQTIRNNDDKINYVHISHFDIDHCNLFGKLAEKYGSQRITIEKFVYGAVGRRFRQNLFEASRLKLYNITDSVSCEEDAFFRRESPYAASDRDTDIDFSMGDSLYFRINTMLFHANRMPNWFSQGSRTISGTLINSGSSIVVASIVRKKPDGSDEPCASFVSTGDATRSTMEVVMEMCDPKFGREEKVITISHHGAKRHVADEDDSFATLKRFLSKVHPTNSCVSAKCTKRKGWTHPHKDTIEIYTQYCKDGSDTHWVSAFEWDSDNRCMIVTQEELTCEVYSTYVLTTADTGDVYDYNTSDWEISSISKTMKGS